MIKQVHFMRALAAIAIVLIHVTSGQVLANTSAYFVNQLVRFASPMFIIIAGMVLVHIELKRPSPSLSYFYKRRFTRVLIPYVIWSLLYFLYNSRHFLYEFQWSALGRVFIDTFPGQLLGGTAFVHLYFILIMVQLYALFPLLYRWLRSHAMSAVTVSFLLTLGLNTLVYGHQLGWFVLPALPVSYVVLCINWIFYFILGMAVMQYEKDWKRIFLSKSAVWIVLVLWVIGLTVLLYDGKASNTYDISVKPSSMVNGVFSFILIYILAYKARLPNMKMMDRGSSLMEWIAQNSFLVYLLHPLCLNVIVKISVAAGNPSIFYGEGGLLLLFGCTTICTLMGIYLINKTPFSVWLGGARVKNSKDRQSTKPEAQMNV